MSRVIEDFYAQFRVDRADEILAWFRGRPLAGDRVAAVRIYDDVSPPGEAAA